MIFNLISILVVLIVLVFSISKWKVHPFIALILASIFLGLLVGMDGTKTINVLLEGFGSTMKWIAIVVILGAFIGEVLNETGGAVRIAEKILKWFGQARLPWAMGITGLYCINTSLCGCCLYTLSTYYRRSCKKE